MREIMLKRVDDVVTNMTKVECNNNKGYILTFKYI